MRRSSQDSAVCVMRLKDVFKRGCRSKPVSPQAVRGRGDRVWKGVRQRFGDGVERCLTLALRVLQVVRYCRLIRSFVGLCLAILACSRPKSLFTKGYVLLPMLHKHALRIIIRPMLRRHSLRVVLLCVAIFGAQVAYVAPARAMATLRAVHCCATRCHHPRSASTAARCCNVQQDVADVAALSPVKYAQPQVIAAPVIVVPTTLQLPNASTLVSSISPHVTPRAAPIFLFTRTLRL